MHEAARRPDGTFAYKGEIYRLEDAERDHFVVRRLGDTRIVGGLRFATGGRHAQIEIDQGSAEREPVAAIARLLDGIRGVLPLQ